MLNTKQLAMLTPAIQKKLQFLDVNMQILCNYESIIEDYIPEKELKGYYYLFIDLNTGFLCDNYLPKTVHNTVNLAFYNHTDSLGYIIISISQMHYIKTHSKIINIAEAPTIATLKKTKYYNKLLPKLIKSYNAFVEQYLCDPENDENLDLRLREYYKKSTFRLF